MFLSYNLMNQLSSVNSFLDSLNFKLQTANAALITKEYIIGEYICYIQLDILVIQGCNLFSHLPCTTIYFQYKMIMSYHYNIHIFINIVTKKCKYA